MNVDMENLYYDDWKSRQFIKRNEDRYKEHVAKNPTARLIDEALKSLVNASCQLIDSSTAKLYKPVKVICNIKKAQ